MTVRPAGSGHAAGPRARARPPLLALGALIACGEPAPRTPPAVPPPPEAAPWAVAAVPTPLDSVRVATVALEDSVRDAGGGQIAWSTFWVACWDAVAGASAYELQTVTSEGTSPRLVRQAGRCKRVQVASGVNPLARGTRDREAQLGLSLGQLAYRVRAVGADGGAGAWSPRLVVGSRRAP